MNDPALQALPEKLERAFARIARERMADVPILNQAIGIHAIGFRRWQQGFLGVMVTPWFMNLMLLPGEDESWDELPELSQSTQLFPSGRYEFTLGHEHGLGRYRMCSLFSPMFEFADDAAAVATAQAVMTELMADRNLDAGDISSAEIAGIWRGEGPPADDAEAGAVAAAGAADPAGPAGLSERLEQPISRRQLLRATLLQDDAQP